MLGNGTLAGHLLIPPNATCQSVFPDLDFEPSMMQVFCDLTSNGTDSTAIWFSSLCCSSKFESASNDAKDVMENFFERMCYSGNITEDLRQEFCEFVPFVPPPIPFQVSLFSYILLSLLTPLGILANLLIIFTVLKCKKLKSTTGYFIANLAIADLFCIFGMIALLIATSLQPHRNITMLRIFSSLDVSIGSASLLNVTAASVERAIAVTKPMVYPLILRKERARKVIAFIWLYCALLFVACCLRTVIKTSTYRTTIFFIAVSLSFFIPCMIVLVSYINISVKALKNLQMEKRIERSMLAVSMLNEGKNHDQRQRKTSRSHLQMRELKLALNLTVMTVPFVFGWGYFMIGNIYEEVSHHTLTGLHDWFMNMLPFIISTLNPVTYLLFTKTLRKEAIKLLAKPFRKFRSLHTRRFSSTSILLTSTRTSRTSDSSETKMI